VSAEAPCFVAPAPGSLDPLFVALGLLVLAAFVLVAAALRRP
jgi:hypothetical protein